MPVRRLFLWGIWVTEGHAARVVPALLHVLRAEQPRDSLTDADDAVWAARQRILLECKLEICKTLHVVFNHRTRRRLLSLLWRAREQELGPPGTVPIGVG